MKKNAIALLLILAAVLSGAAELHGWLIPTLSWPFSAARRLAFLSCPADFAPQLAADGRVQWFGWAVALLVALSGVYLLCRRADSLSLPPQAQRSLERFRAHKRGHYALLLLLGLFTLAAADQLIVGKRALVVVAEDGSLYFPAFRRNILPGALFGLTGNTALTEPDYRELQRSLGFPGGPRMVIMPLVPWAPTADPAPFPTESLPVKDGKPYAADGSSPFDGQACRLYPDGNIHLRIRYRRGVPDGHVQGWSPDRREVYSANWKNGKLITEKFSGEGELKKFLALSSNEHFLLHYHPAPPLTGGHLLGTDSRGTDILAYLFGGLQVNIQAALFYLPLVYGIGLLFGMLMGYLGGIFDLIAQRGIEILSQLPFLFLVMVLTDLLPPTLHGMFVTLSLMALLGWMPMTYLIRTATMKEKKRDYVAAAQAMGAGPLHIMRRHILPNLTPIIITLLPFSTATVILSLTSLDYLGFGLPDHYAAWGRLLNDGLSKLSSPWVASSAVGALVLILLLITFIGEGVREATSPRRHDHFE